MLHRTLAVPVVLFAATAPLLADAPPFKSVVELRKAHDKSLVKDLAEYLTRNPKADDREEGYTLLFDTAIEHDWFAENEAIAKRYLAEQPDGGVRPLAQIVTTMARVQAGRFDQALANFQLLMRGLGKPEQEEFAVEFTKKLASSATEAGEFKVARQAYQALLESYRESAELRQMVQDQLNLLDRVGKRSPVVAATDVFGKEVRLAELKGEYVLINFWATNIAPCVADVPALQAAYARYHGKGFEIIDVSLDENPDVVIDFVKARKLPWRHVHNATGGSDLVEAFGVTGIPASFLVDPSGVITRLDLRGENLDGVLGKELGTRP